MHSITCIALLFLACSVNADQNDRRLGELFQLIKHTKTEKVAAETEQRIWEIWLQHRDQQTQARLQAGITAMASTPREALSLFSQLIEDAPDFAEPWNKRATLHYLLGDYTASRGDIQRTLELEPRHFGALSGLGLIYIALDRYNEAISAFEAVLAIHPHSAAARQNINMLNRQLQRNSV